MVSPDRPPLWIDRAGLDDLDPIAELEKVAFPEPWSRRQFRGPLEGTAGQIVMALRAPGRLMGYIVLQRVVDELHVHNVAVDPALRRRGLGRTLLRAGLAWGERRGTRVAFLEVRRGNVAALALYRGLGFETVGVRKGYYARPREDALVLRRASPDH